MDTNQPTTPATHLIDAALELGLAEPIRRICELGDALRLKVPELQPESAIADIPTPWNPSKWPRSPKSTPPPPRST